jgi:hypothetical protein
MIASARKKTADRVVPATRRKRRLAQDSLQLVPHQGKRAGPREQVGRDGAKGAKALRSGCLGREFASSLSDQARGALH